MSSLLVEPVVAPSGVVSRLSCLFLFMGRGQDARMLGRRINMLYYQGGHVCVHCMYTYIWSCSWLMLQFYATFVFFFVFFFLPLVFWCCRQELETVHHPRNFLQCFLLYPFSSEIIIIYFNVPQTGWREQSSWSYWWCSTVLRTASRAAGEINVSWSASSVSSSYTRCMWTHGKIILRHYNSTIIRSSHGTGTVING